MTSRCRLPLSRIRSPSSTGWVGCSASENQAGRVNPRPNRATRLRGSATRSDEAGEVVPAWAPVVVVRNLSLRGAVHHPLASGRADDPFCHAHVVDVEMGSDQPVQVGDRVTEACQRPVEHGETFGTVDTAVQQRQPPVPFKEVAVDRLRGGKGKRQTRSGRYRRRASGQQPQAAPGPEGWTRC